MVITSPITFRFPRSRLGEFRRRAASGYPGRRKSEAADRRFGRHTRNVPYVDRLRRKIWTQFLNLRNLTWGEWRILAPLPVIGFLRSNELFILDLWTFRVEFIPRCVRGGNSGVFGDLRFLVVYRYIIWIFTKTLWDVFRIVVEKKHIEHQYAQIITWFWGYSCRKSQRSKKNIKYNYL